jgi:hypothetical protein
MYYTKNQDVLVFDAIDDDVLAYRKTAQAGAQVCVTGATYMRIPGKERIFL